MKKLIILFFIMTFQLYSIDWNFTLERMTVDFKDFIHYDSTVICYGTGSIILSSNDNGASWKQRNIHNDTMDIVDMIYRNNRIFALLDSDYIVVKDKDAEDWTSYKINISNLSKIEADKENNIYILADNIVYIFDSQIQPRGQVEIPDTNKFSEMILFNNKIIVSGQKGKLFSIDIDNTKIQELIDFALLGLCTNCSSLLAMKVMDDTLFVLEGGSLFQTGDLIEWNQKTKGINNYSYDIRNKNVYELQTASTGRNLLSYFKFYIHDDELITKISIDDSSRNIENMRLRNFHFLNDSIILGVGFDKLIIRSTDGGTNWDVSSFFIPEQIVWLSDTSCISLGYNKGQAFRSLNSGVTWKPSVIKDMDVYKMRNPKFLYSDDNGKIVLYYPHYSSRTDKDNFMISEDNGISFFTERVDNIYPGGEITLLKKDNEFLLNVAHQFQTHPFTVIHRLDSNFDYIDRTVMDSIQILQIFKEDVRLFALAYDKHWPYNLVTSTHDSNLYSMLYSYDNGMSWEQDFNIDMKDTTLRMMYIKNNQVLLRGLHWLEEPINGNTQLRQLYCLDLETQKIKLIFNNNSSFYVLSLFRDKLVIPGYEYLLENDGNNYDSIYWEKTLIPGFHFRSFGVKGNNIWGSINYTNDSRNVNLYRFIFNTSTDVKEEIEVQTKFFNFPPYPNPAKNIVRTEIYWDLSHDIEKSDIGIYDYKGFRVADSNDFTINFRNSSSGILSWDCSKYDSGIYFIVIKHGDATRTIPVVVSR